MPLEAELSLLDNNDTQSENAESLSGLSVLTTRLGKDKKKKWTLLKCFDFFRSFSYTRYELSYVHLNLKNILSEIRRRRFIYMKVFPRVTTVLPDLGEVQRIRPELLSVLTG